MLSTDHRLTSSIAALISSAVSSGRFLINRFFVSGESELGSCLIAVFGNIFSFSTSAQYSSNDILKPFYHPFIFSTSNTFLAAPLCPSARSAAQVGYLSNPILSQLPAFRTHRAHQAPDRKPSTSNLSHSLPQRLAYILNILI